MSTTTSVPFTSFPEIDADIGRLHDAKDAWVRTGIPRRLELLRRCIRGLVEIAPEWIERACEAQDVDPSGPFAGENWITGPMITIRGFRLMAEALEAGGSPRPSRIHAVAGRAAAKVFPRGPFDALMFPGVAAEVWIRPGMPATQGAIYRDKSEGRFPDGRVCLVLGAGNISSIPPLDALYKLFAEDQVVLVKPNPVNAYVGPLLERALRPLVKEGFLAVVEGAREVAERAAVHPQVDTLHLTGSTRTHDAIVWGDTADEQRRRKASGERLNPRPFTSELGSVTPVLVVPGPWSESDLRRQTRSIAGMVAHNGSFNCNAAKAVVIAAGWGLAARFRDHLRRALAEAPPRPAYYPGAKERYEEFRKRYPAAEPLGASGPGVVPWTLLPDVALRAGEYALSEEAFCGVLAETRVDAAGPAEFLAKAPDAVNDGVWGTLSCVMLVHPATAKEHRQALADAVARLRYGGIAINAWAGMNYALGTTTWGAFPGHTEADVMSGIGVVHNALLFDHPERTVLTAPFRLWPKPVWDPSHRTLPELGRRLASFEAAPGWAKLPAIFAAGVRG